MAVAVNLKKGNAAKKGFVGFSWTTFFFGFFVPLLRGDIKWAGIMIAIDVLVSLTSAGSEDPAVVVGYLIGTLIYRGILAYIYNKRYTESLIKEGFEPAGDSDRTALKFSGIYSE